MVIQDWCKQSPLIKNVSGKKTEWEHKASLFKPKLLFDMKSLRFWLSHQPVRSSEDQRAFYVFFNRA